MMEELRNLNAEILKKVVLEETLMKHKLIAKILSDDDCFKKMSIEYAYAILRDLGFEEDEVGSIYKTLISKE